MPYEKNPNNADVHNLLGYSCRKLGNTEKAFEHYGIVLELDPEHRGANEHLGELYVETGQLEKAEERLQVLDEACFFGCEDYDELKQVIEANKARPWNTPSRCTGRNNTPGGRTDRPAV